MPLQNTPTSTTTRSAHPRRRNAPPSGRASTDKRADDEAADADVEVFCELLEEPWPVLGVSATTGHNLDALKWRVYEMLDIMRIYSKPPGQQQPNYDAPFVMKRGGTLEEFAGRVHKDFLVNLKSARVWGSGVHDGQMVGRDHVLHEGDIVELRI